MRIITLKTLFLLTVVVFSCRTNSENDKIEKKDIPSETPPIEDIPSQNAVAVKLNLIGSEWENNNLQNTQFGLNKSIRGGGIL